MKNLRVAVVPSEKGYDIDQSSSVEQILNCDGTILYPLTDYFKAQNDEEIPLLHWSFLIDIEKNEDLTGTNIDGIHQNTKASMISVIKRILEVWGMTTCAELELDSSPCLSSVGTNKNNVSQLVEEFTEDYARVITYVNENEISEIETPYEHLSYEIIKEIHGIMLDYEKRRGDEEAEE